MGTPSEHAGNRDAVFNSLSVNEFCAVLAANDFVHQVRVAQDGGQMVRYFKLDIDAIASFHKPDAEGKFGIVVLNAYFKGALAPAAVNHLNSLGLLPKFYVETSSTVVELCLPVEAGLTSAAVAYAVKAFEETLRAFVQKRLPLA